MAAPPVRNRNLPAWLTTSLFLIAGACIILLEHKRPLRKHREPKLRRAARNAAVAAVAAIAVRWADAPVTGLLMNRAERRGWGLFRRRRLPLWLEVVAASLALDYSIYLWHVLLHRVPLLWRFHVVHHSDLDLDVSTAIRFHFGELLFSIPLRALQIAALGPSRFTFSLWQTCFGLCVFFHHSEIELPASLERRLAPFLVTPRMHGIHHSIVQRETDSNWSSGLSIWDRLHGTLRLNVPQQAVTIGVPAYREPEQVAAAALIAMPFQHQPPAWEFPDGGSPQRESGPDRAVLLP
ncbi:MAG: sterol desaturase family protein [Bryobacteraceae bacterium]|nr:sterol desaturase family protein [Bryobacteraceae bacterium]